jgi:hypothetical protein
MASITLQQPKAKLPSVHTFLKDFDQDFDPVHRNPLSTPMSPSGSSLLSQTGRNAAGPMIIFTVPSASSPLNVTEKSAVSQKTTS